MDAEVAMLLGEWQEELWWLLRELGSGDELRLSTPSRENLEAVLKHVRSGGRDVSAKPLDKGAWAPWATLAVALRHFRANGCTGEREPTLFPHKRDLKSSWEVVMSCCYRGRHVAIKQQLRAREANDGFGRELRGDGLLYITLDMATGSLITLKVLAEPENLVRWDGRNMSLDQFLTQAAAQAATLPVPSNKR